MSTLSIKACSNESYGLWPVLPMSTGIAIPVALGLIAVALSVTRRFRAAIIVILAIPVPAIAFYAASVLT